MDHAVRASVFPDSPTAYRFSLREDSIPSRAAMAMGYSALVTDLLDLTIVTILPILRPLKRKESSAVDNGDLLLREMDAYHCGGRLEALADLDHATA